MIKIISKKLVENCETKEQAKPYLKDVLKYDPDASQTEKLLRAFGRYKKIAKR